MNAPSHDEVPTELKRLTDAFFRAVSFELGQKPAYAKLYELFVEPGLLIRNSGPTPEIASVAAFIRPRQATVDAGQLTRFHEAEIAATTDVFGNVAQRFSAYTKSGTLNGQPFQARGMVTTQFVCTPAGWKMSSMAWDDERPGLELPEPYASAAAASAA